MKNRLLLIVCALLTLSGVSGFSFADITPPSGTGTVDPRIFSPLVTTHSYDDGLHFSSSRGAACAFYLAGDTESTVGGSFLSGTTCKRLAKDGSFFIASYQAGSACPDDYTPNPDVPFVAAKACQFIPPPSEDCTSKVGQKSVQSMQCYTATCTGGWVADVLSPNGESQTKCTSGFSLVALPIPNPISVAGCLAEFSTMDTGELAMDKSYNGSALPAPVQCKVTYVVTGAGAPSTPPPAVPATPLTTTGPNATGSLVKASAAATGAPNGGQSPGKGVGNGDGTGTTGSAGKTCVPTATVPCTGSGVSCVPTVAKPCTTTSFGTGDCIPTTTQPCSNVGGSTTSSCEKTPVCTGDGVQCAQVVQTWKSMCETKKALTDVPDEVKASLSSISGAAGKAAVEGDANVSASKSTFTTQIDTIQSLMNGMNNSDSCLPDISFGVLGHNVVIPLTDVCSLLALLRLLLHISVDLICVRILASPFLGIK